MYACMHACMHVTLMVCADCESCTWPISTSPGSMEADEYELTRGTCLVAHTVSRWSRSSGCCPFRGVFWLRRDFVHFSSLFFFERTRPAGSMKPPYLIYLSTSITP